MASSSPISIRRATVIQFVSKYASVLVSLGLTVILARILTPDDYGLVAIVTVFTGFFQLFADLGIGVAVVQFRDLTDDDLCRLFTFSILLGLALCLVFVLLAWPISLFYNNPSLWPLLLTASPTLFFNTLNMVPNGYMTREKRFKSIGVRLVVSGLVSGALAVACALLGLGPYALVLQTATSALFVLSWNLWSSPIRHLDRRFTAPLRRVASFSSFQFGFNTVNYFARNLDNLLIGKVFGEAQLGYYSKAYNLTTYPLSFFGSVIASVVQPFMAEHQDHPERIWAFWKRLTKFLSVAGAAICAVMVSCSSEIVMVLYGSQWGQSVPLFSVLAVSVYSQILESTTGAFYQSLGKTNLLFRFGMINTAATVTLLVVGLLTGDLFTVSCLIAAAFVLKTFITFYGLIVHGFHESYRAIAMFLPEVLMAAAAGLLAWWVGTLLPGNVLLDLVVKVAVVAAVLLPAYRLTGQLKYVTAVLHR